MILFFLSLDVKPKFLTCQRPRYMNFLVVLEDNSFVSLICFSIMLNVYLIIPLNAPNNVTTIECCQIIQFTCQFPVFKLSAGCTVDGLVKYQCIHILHVFDS